MSCVQFSKTGLGWTRVERISDEAWLVQLKASVGSETDVISESARRQALLALLQAVRASATCRDQLAVRDSNGPAATSPILPASMRDLMDSLGADARPSYYGNHTLVLRVDFEDQGGTAAAYSACCQRMTDGGWTVTDAPRRPSVVEARLAVAPFASPDLVVATDGPHQKATSLQPAIHAPMEIHYGPPGTGKTYGIARRAVQIIDGDDFVDDPTYWRARYAQLVAARRVSWVTFHPSYAYEDFVEGFRPRLRRKRLVYKVQPGPFRLACAACGQAADAAARLKPGERIGSGGAFEVRSIESGGVVLRSDAGMRFADFWAIERFRSAGLGPADMSIPGSQGARRKQVSAKTGLPIAWFTDAGHFRALYERLLKLESTAITGPVVLVVDEINRADLSRVFGELMTLLETDKRIGAPNETRVRLPYSQDEFGVPANLCVLGTMNTADRSLSVVDMALRRRFEWIEVAPDAGLCDLYGGIDAAGLLTAWNRRIQAVRSRDLLIGHSYLMKEKLEEIRLAKSWAHESDAELRALASVLRTRIVPLLLEYFHDDWKLARFVLGSSAHHPGGSLFRELTFEDLQVDEDVDLDLSEATGFEFSPQWDPDAATWQPDVVAAALAADKAQAAKEDGSTSA